MRARLLELALSRNTSDGRREFERILSIRPAAARDAGADRWADFEGDNRTCVRFAEMGAVGAVSALIWKILIERRALGIVPATRVEGPEQSENPPVPATTAPKGSRLSRIFAGTDYRLEVRRMRIPGSPHIADTGALKSAIGLREQAGRKRGAIGLTALPLRTWSWRSSRVIGKDLRPTGNPLSS